MVAKKPLPKPKAPPRDVTPSKVAMAAGNKRFKTPAKKPAGSAVKTFNVGGTYRYTQTNEAGESRKSKPGDRTRTTEPKSVKPSAASTRKGKRT